MAASGWEPDADGEDLPRDREYRDNLEPGGDRRDPQPPEPQPWAGENHAGHSFQLVSAGLPILLLSLTLFFVCIILIVDWGRETLPELAAVMAVLGLSIMLFFSLRQTWPRRRLILGCLAMTVNLCAASFLAEGLDRSFFFGERALSMVLGLVMLLVAMLAFGNVMLVLRTEPWIAHLTADQMRLQTWWWTHRPDDPARPRIPRLMRIRAPKPWRGDRALGTVLLIVACGISAYCWKVWAPKTSVDSSRFPFVAWACLGPVLALGMWQSARRWRLLSIGMALILGFPAFLASCIWTWTAWNAGYDRTVWIVNNVGNWLVLAPAVVVLGTLAVALWRMERLFQFEIHAIVQAAGGDRIPPDTARAEADEPLSETGSWDEGRADHEPPAGPPDP